MFFIIFMKITIFMLPSVAYDKSAALRKKIASFVCIIIFMQVTNFMLANGYCSEKENCLPNVLSYL